MPWVIRHAAYLLNRYAIHNDGKTSFFRRWNKEHKTPLCEFGLTIQYMVAHHKKMPKLESRFYKGIWLGTDTMTSESIIGISGKIIRTRTIRRQIEPEKYDRQLMDIINAPPWTPVSPTEALQPAMLIPASTTSAKQQATTETQTALETTATNTDSRSKRIATTRNTCSTNGNSTNKSSKKTTTANAKETTTRWDYTRQWAQATKDSRRTTANTKTWTSRATNNKDEDQCNPGDYKERWDNHHDNMWRPTRSKIRKNSTRANGPQHRGTWQEENNRRHEAWGWTNEETRCLLWGEHQGSHTRTTSNNHRIKMGVERQRRQSKSKNSGKRIHWTNRRLRRNLRKHTNILQTSYPSHNGNGQTMDSQSRWHFSSISTCQCCNKRFVHVAPTRVLQWLLANSMETPQSNVRTKELTISMAKSPSANPTRS